MNTNTNMERVYEKLKSLQTLAWKYDDMMDQEALFRLQDDLAELTLEVASKCGMTSDLVRAFPWIYEIKEGHSED